MNKIMNAELVYGNMGEGNKNTISPLSGKAVTILGEGSIKSAVSLKDIEKKQGL